MSRNPVVWDNASMVQELQRLVAHGVIGLYCSFEITEVLAFQQGQPGTQPPVNILTVAVAESAVAPQEIPELPFLNRRPLALRGTGWNIGVSQYRIPVQALVDAANRFSRTGEWKTGRAPLQVGKLAPVAPQFVPANSFKESPWNGVLKNNFWQGSHVLELFDTSKSHVKFLLDDSRMLAELTKLIRVHVPIGIDGMSDRLGNILIQLPVTVISTGARGSPEGDHNVTVAWHPDARPRPVRVFAEIYEDSTVQAFDFVTVTSGGAPLRLYSPGGGARTHIWDDQHRVLLAATAVESFITSIALSMHGIVAGREPPTRHFLLPSAGNQTRPQSIILNRQWRPHIVGSSPARPREPWLANRLFAESQSALQARKEFIQYGRVAGSGTAEAFEDIHWLIKEHGAAGVWLWDPYLNADDVLRTLFFCPHDGVELRALTSGAEPPVSSDWEENEHRASSTKASVYATWKLRLLTYLRNLRNSNRAKPLEPSWEEKQAARIEAAKGNCEGLKLEYRIRKGSAGWSFHDRFIIFPRADGPALAWSLGTSVNSLGRQHHILQKVSNGELIANAFRDLWEKLEAPDYLIWRTP